MTTETPTPQAPEQEPKKRGFKFPTAFTVLFFVLVAVWALSFVIKPGGYYYVSCDDGSARPIAGSYHNVEVDKSFVDRLQDLWLSPVNGLYGVREVQGETVDPTPDLVSQAEAACGADTESVVILDPSGYTTPGGTGDLVGAVAVFFFVLAIGAFITVTINTGALDAGIGALTHRYRKRGTALIVLLMVVFSIGGTTYGMAEETIGFYALIVPIMIGLGYDRMVGATVIMIGAGTGTMASTVNPFATGVASDSAGIALGDGLIWRLIMYLIVVPVAILFVLRYAQRVKKDPSRSLVPHMAEDDQLLEIEANPPAMTSRQKLVMWIFAATFVLMIFSVIPWSDLFAESAFAESITLGWFFPELAALFLVGSIVIGLIGGLGEEKMVGSIVQGMGDFMSAALIIAVARGVVVIMNNASVTDTVLNALEGVVSGLSSGLFAVMIFIVNIPLAFLVPSSSAHAALAMPIMAPLADFAEVSRAMVVTGYQFASGWMNLFTPTSAVVMGGLTLAKVGYDKYLRFVWPLLLIFLVLVSGLLVVGTFVPALSGSV